MNKNQKQIRAIARKNNGKTFNINRNYNGTIDTSGRPTEASFPSRNIPQVSQDQLSAIPKVGWRTRPFDHWTRRQRFSAV